MIKKTILIACIAFICAAPAALANDGGAWPDYNEYVTYTVKTNCKEIAIGEELVFTLTMTNHTSATWGYFYPGSIISNTYLPSETFEELRRDFLDLEPYSTNKMTFSYVIPEDVNWYKKDGEYYIDLSPSIAYMFQYDDWDEWEEFGLPYDFFANMIGVEPIPIQLTNVNDGSHLVSMDIVDDNEYFVYSDRYPADFKEAYTYFGEYEGGVVNHIKIENISDDSYDVVYIDGYKWNFTDKKYPFVLQGEDSIIIDNEYSLLRLPEDVPEHEQVSYNMLFKDTDGNYYGTSIQKEYDTVLYEITDIEFDITEIEDDENGSKLLSIDIRNIGTSEKNHFFVCYGDNLPESEGGLDTDTKKGDLKINGTWTLPDYVELEYREVANAYASGGYYNMGSKDIKVGYYTDEYLCYSIMAINYRADDDGGAYSIGEYSVGVYVNMYNNDDIELFDIAYYLRHGTTPTPTNTPIPEITANPSTPEPTPTVEATATPTAEIKVVDSKSYIIPPWVYIALGVAMTAMVILMIRKRSMDNDGDL